MEHDTIFSSPLICVGRENDGRDITALTVEGIPVIIETKLSNNKDLRDVIAQIFDYASRLNQITFYDLNEYSKSFFSRPEYKGAYKGLDLIKAFIQFQGTISDEIYYNEKEFIVEINKNLRDGNFILLLVVDSIREDVLRSIQFLNSKLVILRIEVIKVSKYQHNEIILYSSSHINIDTDKKKSRIQVKKTYDELCENWTKDFKKAIDVFKVTLQSNGFEFDSKTGGLPIKYNGQPVMFLRQDHIEIANHFLEKNGYKDLANKLLDLIKKKFTHLSKFRINFKEESQKQNITPDKMKAFAEDVINICRPI